MSWVLSPFACNNILIATLSEANVNISQNDKEHNVKNAFYGFNNVRYEVNCSEFLKRKEEMTFNSENHVHFELWGVLFLILFRFNDAFSLNLEIYWPLFNNIIKSQRFFALYNFKVIPMVPEILTS